MTRLPVEWRHTYLCLCAGDREVWALLPGGWRRIPCPHCTDSTPLHDLLEHE